MAQPIPAHWFQILLSLADRDHHGLAITKDVFERTGHMNLWPGMLYGALRLMTKQGLVVEVEAPEGFSAGGGRPRFYHLTPAGRRLAASEARRLSAVVETARARKLLT